MSFDPSNAVGTGIGAAISAGLVRIFTYTDKDFPFCHTKILRAGRGFPWNKQVAVHTTAKGEFTMEFVDVEYPKKKTQKKAKKK